MGDIVKAVELEGDNISNGSSDGARAEGILSTLTDLDSEGSGNSARDQSEKGECVDHVERLYKEGLRRYELINYLKR